ncbi:hypothetical protein ACQPW1_11545 [Nocardia sp. CA-128927]|uniref:hypothetical protein n=1 Tax=Nocardia sp. CA-128927 TaxID=3239975 RepID=UPI003D985B67
MTFTSELVRRLAEPAMMSTENTARLHHPSRRVKTVGVRLKGREVRYGVVGASALGGVLAISAVVLMIQQWSELQPGQGAVIGGGAVLSAAFLTFYSQHRSRSSEEARAQAVYQQQERTREQTHQREVRRALHDRYAKIIEQMGQPSEATKLGAITALASLADDWYAIEDAGERTVCIGLLLSYMYMPEPEWPPGLSIEGTAPQHIREHRRVKKAIAELISSRQKLAPEDPRSWSSIFHYPQQNGAGGTTPPSSANSAMNSN